MGARMRAGEEDPRALFRPFHRDISPHWACRSWRAAISTNRDRKQDAEPVVIVSQSVAQRMFPNQDAINRHI